MKFWRKPLLTVLILIFAGVAYWKFAIPSHRIVSHSELIMFGDLDGDHRWTTNDTTAFDAFIADPSGSSNAFACLLDLNQNNLIDPEDRHLLQSLSTAGSDPYAAEEAARTRRERFPRPREFYRYQSTDKYQIRPMWALPYLPAKGSTLTWFADLKTPTTLLNYENELDAAIYSEAVRFDQAWQRREAGLLPIERTYAALKLSRANELYRAGEKFELLLALTELTEDAETLTTRNVPDLAVKLLTFRDHLRELLNSSLFSDFHAGRQDWHSILQVISDHLQTDLNLTYDFENLGPPRSLSNLENYLQRAEWQYYKSTAHEDDFRALIAFAQHDPRYRRAASRTSRKLQDPGVINHNLPMVLLFREALRLVHGDKKNAAGLLDEAIRTPFAWMKSIPREKLPASLAYDNFLLPGNKEDGADKSRHWNVFGAICLYKSPQEALDLALKREMNDLRAGNFAEPEMREFLRDMIGNLNGMFHVMAVSPTSLSATPSP